MSPVMTPQSPDDPGKGSPGVWLPKPRVQGTVAHSRGHGSDMSAGTKVSTQVRRGWPTHMCRKRNQVLEEPGTAGVARAHTRTPVPSTSDAGTEDACFPWPRVQPGRLVRARHANGSRERTGLPVSPALSELQAMDTDDVPVQAGAQASSLKAEHLPPRRDC